MANINLNSAPANPNIYISFRFFRFIFGTIFLYFPILFFVLTSESGDLQNYLIWGEVSTIGSENRFGVSRAWFLAPFYTLGLEPIYAIPLILALVFSGYFSASTDTSLRFLLCLFLLATNIYLMQLSVHLLRQMIGLVILLFSLTQTDKLKYPMLILSIMFHEFMAVIYLIFLTLQYFSFKLKYAIVITFVLGSLISLASGLVETLTPLAAIFWNPGEKTVVPIVTNMLMAIVIATLKLDAQAEKYRMVVIVLIGTALLSYSVSALLASRILTVAYFLFLIILLSSRKLVFMENVRVPIPLCAVTFNFLYAGYFLS